MVVVGCLRFQHQLLLSLYLLFLNMVDLNCIWVFYHNYSLKNKIKICTNYEICGVGEYGRFLDE
jgi:hypothetical protein